MSSLSSITVMFFKNSMTSAFVVMFNFLCGRPFFPAKR
jgi:hypothetical protein